MKKNDLDPDYLRSLFDYDPASGVIRWKVRKARRIKVGDVAGRPNSTGYLQVRIDGRQYSVHRLVWVMHYGTPADEDLDHIDRNRSNNIIGNLRSVSRSENLENTLLRSDNTSGFKGVFWHKLVGRWAAVIYKSGVKHRLGYFDCPQQAACAYGQSAAVIHKFNPSANHNQVPK